jgi:hypothetical protein
MAQYINKDDLVKEIEKRLDELWDLLPNASDVIKDNYTKEEANITGKYTALESFEKFINTLEVKEVGVWKTVDNINIPQADRNKIYCVLSKGKYLLAKVINHPHDELLQWCCTEFPFHCYDMCEGDKYMQIV